MTVHLSETGAIVLAGACPIEDAEPLLRYLLDRPGAAIDWERCEQMHAAVFQVIMAARPPIIGSPASAFLRQCIQPMLAGSMA